MSNKDIKCNKKLYSLRGAPPPPPPMIWNRKESCLTEVYHLLLIHDRHATTSGAGEILFPLSLKKKRASCIDKHDIHAINLIKFIPNKRGRYSFRTYHSLWRITYIRDYIDFWKWTFFFWLTLYRCLKKRAPAFFIPLQRLFWLKPIMKTFKIWRHRTYCNTWLVCDWHI